MNGHFSRLNPFLLPVLVLAASTGALARDYECVADGEFFEKTVFFQGDYVSADSRLHHYSAKERDRAKGVLTGSIEYEEKGQKRTLFLNLSAKEKTYTLELREEPSRKYEFFAAVPCGIAVREGADRRIAFDFVNVANSDDSNVRIRTLRFVFNEELTTLVKIEYVSYNEFYKLGRRTGRQTISYPMKPNLAK